MTKKKQQKPRREVTKRQLSRWQQQQKRQRLIIGSGIFVVVAAVVTVVAGWYITQYRPLHETVVTVNDTSFNMNYYVNMLKVNYTYGLTDDVVRLVEQNELIRQGALKLDISVSNDEVDQELKRIDSPLSKDYINLLRAEMLVIKLLDEYFEHQVPLSAEQRHILAMFLESESQAIEVMARLEAGGDFAELAGELSLESISQTKNGDLGWHPEDVLPYLLYTSIPVDYAFDAQVGVLSQPIYDEEKTKSVGYWLIKVLERKEGLDEVHVQAILLSNEAQAQGVRARLGAGEDFAALAEELSQHERSRENGGDMGGSTPGAMSPAFDEFAFNYEVELETVSEPIRDDTVVTTGGYWLIKLLDTDDNRKIEDDDRNLLKAKALDEWVTSLWDDPENKVESYLDEDKMSWAISKAIEGLGQ